LKEQKEIKLFIGITILFWAIGLYAQPPETLWTKTYGGVEIDAGFSIQQTFDGGYIIAGHTTSFGAGGVDVWLIKTNENGETLWTRTYGSGVNEACVSVQQTSDSGYIIVGSRYTSSPGDTNVYIVKTRANGDTIWTRTYGGTSSDKGLYVRQTFDGGYIVTGWTNSFGAGGYDVFLRKLEANGDSIWTKSYGGIYDDFGICVQQTTDSGYIVAGYYGNAPSRRNLDYYLIKTNVNGDTSWTRKYGGSVNDGASGVCQCSDEGYVIVGAATSGAVGIEDLMIVKTNANGDALWTRMYGWAYSDGGKSVQPTSDGGYIIGGMANGHGWSTSQLWLVKIDANGDTLWTRIHGDPAVWNKGYVAQQTSDGGYIIVGETESFGNSRQVWVIKTVPDFVGLEQENPSAKQSLRLSSFFNPVEIKYYLPHKDHIKVRVYDVNGRMVGNLLDELQEAGDHTLTWNKRIAQGIYFIQLKTSETDAIKKVVIY